MFAYITTGMLAIQCSYRISKPRKVFLGIVNVIIMYMYVKLTSVSSVAIYT